MKPVLKLPGVSFFVLSLPPSLADPPSTHLSVHTPGSWRVSVGAYTGGDVMSVLVAALIGGFSAGQVGTPSFHTQLVS